MATTSVQSNCNHGTSNGSSNNNNMINNNLNLTSSHNGLVAHTHLTGGTTAAAHQAHGVSPASAAQILTYRNGRRSIERNDSKPFDANALQPMANPPTTHADDHPYAHFAITRSLINMLFQFVCRSVWAIYSSVRNRSGSMYTQAATKTATTPSPEPAVAAVAASARPKLDHPDTKYSYMDADAAEPTAANKDVQRLSADGTDGKSAYNPVAIKSLSSPLYSPSNADSALGNGNAIQHSCDTDNKMRPHSGTENETAAISETSSSSQANNVEANERSKGKPPAKLISNKIRVHEIGSFVDLVMSGRRNRGKQKDNVQQQNQSHIQPTSKDNQNHLPAQPSEPCEACARLEFELKTLRADINHLKQSENELQRKCDQSLAVKSCLQAKQKVNEELEKRYARMMDAHPPVYTLT